MDENKSQQKENSTSSDDDTKNRSIMLWTSKIESFLLEIKNKCISLASAHEKKYIIYKIVFYTINIPEAILLFILTTATTDFKNNNEEITNTITILAGILSLINSFINPGKLNTEHLHYKNLYNELVQQIDIELIKSKSLRIDADIFLNNINSSFTNLNNKAPGLE